MPSMVQAWCERKEPKQFEQIARQFEQLTEVIDILRKEAAMLKDQRIIKP
jgi:acetolactate synthase small subunit